MQRFLSAVLTFAAVSAHAQTRGPTSPLRAPGAALATPFGRRPSRATKPAGGVWALVALGVMLVAGAAPAGVGAQGVAPAGGAQDAASPATDVAPERQYLFWHADRSWSGFVVHAAGGAYQRVADRTQRIQVPAGSLVCVDVVNGHPINYAYSLSVSVDSSAAALPDLSGQAKLIAPVLPKAAGDTPRAAGDAAPGGDKVVAPAIAWAEAVAAFGRHVDTLQNDVAAARRVVLASDRAESLTDQANGRPARAGLRFAQDSLAAFPRDAGRFNDPKLKETLETRATAALKAVGEDRVGQLAASAVAAYAQALRSERDQLAGAFARADAIPRACGTVGRGRSTLRLAVAPKDNTAKLERATTKDLAFQVVNDAPYDRPLVSIAPVAFAAAAPGTPSFVVDNGVLRDAGTRAHYRLGAVIAFNRFAGGPFNLFGTSFGLGIGSEGNDNPISDLFATVMLSVGDVVGARSDALRVGLGAGVTRAPDLVKGVRVGDPYPASAGALDDNVERSWRPALYLTFAVPTLNLGSSR